MGAGHSNGHDEQRPPQFIVPTGVDLTPRQLSILIETGHQPGIPFPVVTQEAVVERPIRQRTTFFHSQCHIHKDSVDISTTDDDDALIINFIYDATSESQIFMYLFSKEPTTENPKLAEDSLTFQMQCQPGMQQQFSGVDYPESHIAWSEVEKKHCAGDEHDISSVDFLVVVQPTGDVDDAPVKMVDAEVTCIRLVISELEESYAINKIVTQKVKTSLGYYNVQELFGIDADDTVHTHPAENKENNAEEKGETEVDQIDTNAECVICLTNPRDIALLPCRHTCLCATCAAALTSQQNKCPICRRRAEMCLHLIPVNPEGHV